MKVELKLIPCEDFTDKKFSWNILGDVYNYVTDQLEDNYGDGEWRLVVVERQSDKKLFGYYWGYYRGNYDYEEEWIEVKPILTTTYVRI